MTTSLDDLEVVPSRPLSDEDKKLAEDIRLAAQEVIRRVRERSLELHFSKIVGENLFIRSGSRYIVITPDGGIGHSVSDMITYAPGIRLDALPQILAELNIWLKD